MASPVAAGRTELIVAPLRSAATRTGTSSCESPRMLAFPPRFRALRSGGSVTDWPFCARFHSCDPLRLDSTKVSSASTMPPSISPAGFAASRNRWRQRNAVLWAIPQRLAA